MAESPATKKLLGAAFTNTSLNANSYMWDFGDGITSIDPNAHHLFTSSGYHTVTLYAYNDCGVDSISYDILIVVTGMDEHNGISATIYPNPGNGDMTLELSGINGQLQVSVLDLEGRILVRELHQSNGSYSTRLDLNSTLAKGVYLVRVDSDNGSIVKKIVIQ